MSKAKQQKSKVVEVQRWPMGIYVCGTGNRGGRAFPSAHMIYEVRMSDGSMKIEQGRAVYGSPGSAVFNGTKAERKRAAESVRTDLRTHIEAASVLLRDLEYACLALDGQLVGGGNG